MTQQSSATAGISLRKLLAENLRERCASDALATSCTSDWRQVQPGDVFIAITGDEEDGHDHATKAAERGAVAIICEQQLPVFSVPQFIVADSRTAYGKLCQALVGNPTRHMKVIGVTGSHGKTSVARLLSAILREAGATVGALDSYGYWDGVEDRPASGPLSPPLLAQSLAEMAAVGATHAVIEISGRDLARQTLAGISLDAACITQIGDRDLGWHGSTENYRQTTRRILDCLDDYGVAVLNADDPASVEVLDDVLRPVLTFGMGSSSEISATVIEQFVNEQMFLLTAGDDSVGVRTEIVGDHHVYNCLAAATVGLAFGAEPTTIARGLESVDRLPGRMERVTCGQDFAVFVDSANSPEALRRALRAARQVTSGRVICVYGANDEGNASERPAVGRVIGSFADVAAITHGNPTDFASHRSCLEIRTGFADPAKARVILDRQEAIHWALAQAKSGDIVLIAGMGTEPHTPLGSEGALANDRELIEAALRSTIPVEPLRLAA